MGNGGNLPFQGVLKDLTRKRGSVGQSEGMLLARSSVQFRLKPSTQIPIDLNYIDPQSRVLNYC